MKWNKATLRKISEHENDKFKIFEFADFVDYWAKNGGGAHNRGIDEWAGGSFADTVNVCKLGDLAAVNEAEKLADMICDSVDVSGLVPSWRLDVSGAFACVPEYLAGSPECMYNQCPVQSTASPLDMAICITVSWKMDQAEMRRRGVCLLAAAMAINRVRPVNLWLYSNAYFERPLVRLSSRFDVSEVCAALTRPAVSRHLFVGYSYNALISACHPKWCYGVPLLEWDQETAKRKLVELGGLSHDCLVLTNKIGEWANMERAAFVEELNGMIRNVASVDSVAA